MTVVKIDNWRHEDNRPISDYAYERLVGKILRLEIPPGAPLVEKALIEEFEIGRTPMREALHAAVGRRPGMPRAPSRCLRLRNHAGIDPRHLRAPHLCRRPYRRSCGPARRRRAHRGAARVGRGAGQGRFGKRVRQVRDHRPPLLSDDGAGGRQPCTSRRSCHVYTTSASNTCSARARWKATGGNSRKTSPR